MVNALELITQRFGANLSLPVPIGLRISRHRELLELWCDLGYKVGAEIGTEEGRYAEQICRAIPGVKLFCIDPYKAYSRYADTVSQSRLDHFYRVAQHRLTEQNQFNVEIIRETSLEAVKRFKSGSLDFVFIDAVNAYAAAHKISPWFVTKGDKCPSWLWVNK